MRARYGSSLESQAHLMSRAVNDWSEHKYILHSGTLALEANFVLLIAIH